ncbi:MAG: hypothetical protein HPY44_10800 [Armatimonadetes bacterium]|nr:hypothetical protein [Armatimonadota bacterium]
MIAQLGARPVSRVCAVLALVLLSAVALAQSSDTPLDPGGLVRPPELIPPRPVAPAAVGTRAAGATWSVLVLIYPNSDFSYQTSQGATQTYTGSITESQVQRFERAAASFVDLVDLWSEGLGKASIEVHRIERPIATVTKWEPEGALNYWISHDDVATELQQYIPTGKYDSVLVFGHMGTAPTPSYWGLSWVGPISFAGRTITYGMVRYNKDSAWDESFLGEVPLHEWLHGLEGWYRDLGYQVPDLHSLVAHGFPDPGGNVPMWRDWYAHYMCGKLTEPNGDRSGMSAGVWAGGTPLSTANPLPCQLLAPADGSTHTGSPSLKWAATEADDYRVTVRTSGSGQDLASAIVTRTSWSPPLNKLQNNTNYTWFVQGRKSGVWSAQVETLSFRTGTLVDPGEQRKPDLLIRHKTETATFHGDGLYNDTGLNQTVESTTAYQYQFVVLAENDAQVADVIRITAPPAPSGWTAKYEVGGQDKTAQINGSGYSVDLAAGGVVEINVTVTGSVQVGGQDVWQLLITGTSTTDPSRGDTVKAAITRAAPRPDALQKLSSDALFRGGNVYDMIGSQQTLWAAVDSGQAASFWFRVENDAAGPDDLVLSANSPATGWTVAYYDKNGNYSGNVLKTTIVGVPPNAWAEIRLDITPGASVAAGTTQEIEVRVTSGDGSTRDVCRFVAGQKPFANGRPDAMARSRVDLPYVGENVVGAPLSLQTCRSILTAGDVTAFTLRLDNASEATDALTLRASAAPAGWTVRYFDALYGGNDITSAVRGSGWTTGSLGAGAGREVRVEMTAGATAGPVCQVQCTLASPRGATDTIELVTVRGGADMTGEGDVDWKDIRAFLNAWRRHLTGLPCGPAFDLDGDGNVDHRDVAQFMALLASGAFGPAQ